MQCQSFPSIPICRSGMLQNNSIVNKHYNKMQAPRSEYRIVRTLRDHLIISKKSTDEKFIYRQYKQTPQNLLTNQLERLKAISHPNVIRVYEAIQDAGHVGVYFQHYAMDLASRVGLGSGAFDQELLLNTIEPIKQAVEYLHSIDRHPSDITPRNIVVTEKGDIKLIDDLLLSSETVYQQQQHSKEGDYTRLLQTTLRLIDGSRPDSSKTFKQQLKKLKARTSREMYRFLDELYEKSKPVAPKLKKIRKRMSVNNQNKERSNPRNKLGGARTQNKTCLPQLISIKPLN